MMQNPQAAQKQKTELIFKLTKASSPFASNQSRKSILKRIQQLEGESQYSRYSQSFRVGESTLNSKVLDINISKGKLLQQMTNGRERKVSFTKGEKRKDSVTKSSIDESPNIQQAKQNSIIQQAKQHAIQVKKQEFLKRSQSQKIHKDIALLKTSTFSKFRIVQESDKLLSGFLSTNNNFSVSNIFVRNNQQHHRYYPKTIQSRHYSTEIPYRSNKVEQSRPVNQKHSPISKLMLESKFGLQNPQNPDYKNFKSIKNKQDQSVKLLRTKHLQSKGAVSISTRVSSCRQIRQVKPIFQQSSTKQIKQKTKSQKQKLNFQLQLFKRKLQLKMH